MDVRSGRGGVSFGSTTRRSGMERVLSGSGREQVSSGSGKERVSSGSGMGREQVSAGSGREWDLSESEMIRGGTQGQ